MHSILYRPLACVVATCLLVATGAATVAQGAEPIVRLEVSLSASPMEQVEVPVPGAPATPAVIRKPPGRGPFPALIHLHGGLEPWPMSRLKEDALTMPTSARFLAAGYVIVVPTFRTRAQDPQTSDALADCLAVVEYVKKLPEVDPKSIVVWGNSGGGSLALELAGEASLSCVLVEEPATVLFAGMFTKESLGGRPPFTSSSGNAVRIMADPKKYYTPELQRFTRDKIAKISCPVFMALGGTSKINKINDDIIVPELQSAGKAVEVIHYPGQPHGFSKGSSEAAAKFYDDASAFALKALPTKPHALDASIVKTSTVESRQREGRTRNRDNAE